MRLYLFLFFLIIGFSTFGQKRLPNKEVILGEIFGQVLDDETNLPIEYATVSLLDFETDVLVTGITTDRDGKFDLLDILPNKYKLKVSFIGYTDFVLSPLVINRNNTVHKLGVVRLDASILLDEIVVDGTTPNISYEIDKKIIDVSNLNTDLAQSAVEILENIPSITIDDDGSVQLRGSSSFTLLIDGKPTAIDASEALNTIPASTIKNIEIITNPSAKYDAEGVSGIINIVLKRNKLQGISMLTNLNLGNYKTYGGDIAIDFREKKYGFNISANMNHKPRLSDKTSERVRNIGSGESLIFSDSEINRLFQMSKIKGEFVYEPNTLHSLIIGGGYNWFFMDSYNNVNYETYVNGMETGKYLNIEDATRHFKSVSSSIVYRLNINRDKKHYLEFKSVFSEWNGDEVILSDLFETNGYKYGGTKRTETGPSKVFRLNLDYSRKIRKSKMEMGIQAQFGQSSDDSDNFYYDVDAEDYFFDEQLSKDVVYDRDIFAGYALYGKKIDRFGIQSGLRVEHTLRDIRSTNSVEFTKIDRWDWFPSVHMSYRISKKQEVLVNYSRRINRPRSYYFEPFITWNSAYSVSSGNPELLPEYIDAFELNWMKRINRKGNIGVELYYRNTKNKIERTQTIYQDDILLRSPVNIGKSLSVGLQASVSYKVLKWWKSDMSINLYKYKILGEINNEDYNSDSFNWNGRWTNTFPLKRNWRIQAVTNYNSPTIRVQGRSEGFFTVNSSIKKSFGKKKYSLVLQGRDIFMTRKRESFIETGDIKIHSIRTPKSPKIILTFSMRLNNYEKKRSIEEVDDI